MSGLFYKERGIWWAIAITGSCLSHLAVAAVALGKLPDWPRTAPPDAATEITITSLVMEESEPPPETTASLPPEEQAPSEPEEVPPAAVESDPPEAPDTVPDVTENPILPELEGDLGAAGASPAAPEPPAIPDGGVDDPDVPPPPESEEAALPPLPAYVPPPPPNAEALRLMVQRIKEQIDQPCLIALPQIGASETRLLVFGESDLAIRDASASILIDPEMSVASQPVLMARQQCPALQFLRAREEYPAFGLSIGLVSGGILSGGRLIGRIDGIASGSQTTLLLVDDNGVVQDLRRFLRFASGSAEFDIPVTRDGEVFDTSQLLIAAVTSERLDTVTNLGGLYAEEFFPALAKELGQSGTLAVIPFDLR